MSADETQAQNEGRSASPELQFDRLESEAPGSESAASGGIVCAMCQKPVGSQYYHVNGKQFCESCRQIVMNVASTPRTAAPLVRAGIFGLGAAIAGAAIYYAVIAIANLEIGLVAILIGYMVGYSVRKGAGGRGGRRFQILAVLLTYWSVGLAYAPLAYKGAKQSTDQSTEQSADTSANAAPSLAADSARGLIDSGTASTAAKPDTSTISGGEAAVALGGLFLLVFALPVMSVFGSMPFGLISAFIIFIGLRQAWSMTAAPVLEISGPYRVGSGPAPAAG